MIVKPINYENLSKLLKYELEDSESFSIKDLLDLDLLNRFEFKQAIIYNYDSVIVNELQNLLIDADNIIEARLFDETKEIRIFKEDENLSGVIFIEDDGDKDIIIKEYILNNGDQCKYTKLKIKEYIDFDEDGQAYIKYVRPTKLINEMGVKINETSRSRK